MKTSLLAELAEAGIKILKNKQHHMHKECCCTAQDLANWIDAPRLAWLVRDNLREVRDAIQAIEPSWVLHTMTQDGFDAVDGGVPLSEVECVPMGGRSSFGLRLVTQKDDITYLSHCRHRDFIDDRRRDRHDKDTFRALEIGILTKEQAQVQFETRLAGIEDLQINGVVDDSLKKIETEHAKLCRLTKLRGVSWIIFMAHRTGLAAAPPTRMGYITANRMLLDNEINMYVKVYKKPAALVSDVVQFEYELHLMRMFQDDPKTLFPKNKVFGVAAVHNKIRKRLGIGTSKPY